MWCYQWTGKGQSEVMVQLDRMMTRLSDQGLWKLAKNGRVQKEKNGMECEPTLTYEHGKNSHLTGMISVHPPLLESSIYCLSQPHVDTTTHINSVLLFKLNSSIVSLQTTQSLWPCWNDRQSMEDGSCSGLIANFPQPHSGRTSPSLWNSIGYAHGNPKFRI